MADLCTTYMGIELTNPIVPSASPLSRNLGEIKDLEDAGAAAVVLYSLFEEQIALETGELSHLLSSGALSLADAMVYFPHRHDYPRDPDEYVEHVRQAKQAVDIPIIASMNGTSKGGWLEYAKMIEEAGADGLELNVYYLPTADTLLGMDVENLYLDILKSVKGMVKIPVAVKLSPFFSALPNFASQLDDVGADALVLFNRFYQPDIDIEAKEVLPRISLSRSEDILLPLRWIAILYGQVGCSLALTSGVHSGAGVIKAVMVGADVAHIASVLLAGGIDKLQHILVEMEQLLEKIEIDSIGSLKGSLSLQNYVEPTAFERASYIKLLQSYGRI
ncbi:MAG: dihydroorotate dehydrogenase-like protein [Anaerolineales bacterium]|nr:dihydroorotate dehydrogenase-like protein [Anaerolineales bacterium]